MSERDQEPRFAFGENWTRFLASIDESRIQSSIDALATMLGQRCLKGKTFLDIGCGSGLASLSAYRVGAMVHSFDFDPMSVSCTKELRRRFGAHETRWIVEQGSALDEPYLEGLGQFDVVYSWGVLHHTGNMDLALRLARQRVKQGGLFFIAIYHDQGSRSRRWAWIKQTYHRLPAFIQPLWVISVASLYEAKFALTRLAHGRNPMPFADWKNKSKDRGMSAWHDWVDWVGGWPFEVASPDQIINPMIAQGFELMRLKTVGNGWGCNEYVFRLTGSTSTSLSFPRS